MTKETTRQAKEALARALQEQDYSPQFAEGVLKMLEMNGWELVKTEQLDSLMRGYRNGFNLVNDAVVLIDRTTIERYIER